MQQGVFDLYLVAKEELAVSNSKLSELKANIEAEKKKRDEAEVEKALLANKCERLTTEIEKLQADIDEIRGKHQDTESYVEEVTKLRVELSIMEDLKNELQRLRKENEELKTTCSVQESSLLELADQLGRSKLEMEELRYDIDQSKENKWMADDEAVCCYQCEANFSLARRKHHCRNCGMIFCNDCSNKKRLLPSSSKPVRVCDECDLIFIKRLHGFGHFVDRTDTM